MPQSATHVLSISATHVVAGNTFGMTMPPAVTVPATAPDFVRTLTTFASAFDP